MNDTKFVDANLEMMQKAFLAYYQPLQRYGGMLRQFLMDDKGMVAILVFTGKESNSTYACRCALDVNAEMKKQSIACSIGIASGRVFCGPVGCPLRCEYAFVGDSVNLSARLMCKADTYAIITDRSTADSASRSIQFREHGSMSLKGKSGKVRMWCERIKKSKLWQTGHFCKLLAPPAPPPRPPPLRSSHSTKP